MPKNSPYNGLPMLYTRLNDTGTAFEDARNLMKVTFGLDGGGSVAADSSGNVYVAWHGKSLGDSDGEAGRSVWIARSGDGGRSFTPEYKAYQDPTGACGCCGLSIFAGKNEAVYILYRTAREMVHRDTYLLVSKDSGRTFKGRVLDEWNIAACPMTSAAIAEGRGEVLAAWQTKDQVYYAGLDPSTLEMLCLPVYTLYSTNPAFTINGFKIRELFVQPHAHDHTFFYGLNYEFSVNARQWEDRRISSEIRPVIGLHLHPWDLIYNPIVDTDFTGSFGNLQYNPAGRITYNLNDRRAVAVEAYDGFGPLRRCVPYDQQFHEIWAVMDRSSSTFLGLAVEAGIEFGLTPGSDKITYKLMLSVTSTRTPSLNNSHF